MKTSVQITLTLLLITMFANAQDTWVQKADFGGATRTGAAGFSIAGKGYIGTGFSNYEWQKDFWEYDPLNDVWTQKADFGGVSREGGVGFSIGDKGYLGTGENGDEWPFTFNDFWEYDPLTNTWTRKADLPGGSRGRYTAVAFTIGSKGYVGLGSYFGIYDPFCWDDFWEYDPVANAWTKKADFGGGARASAMAFAVDNKGYAGTGSFFEEVNGQTFYTRYKDFWQYDPVLNVWTRKADFPVGERFSASGFSVLDKGYLSLGFDVVSGTTKKDLWEYDPLTNNWLQKTDFPGNPTSRPVAFTITDKAYMGVGNNFKDFWQYTPAATSDTCSLPAALRVVNVTRNAALIKWNIPADTPANYKIRYRAVGDTTTVLRKTKGSNNRLLLTGLKANTTYKWQMRSICVFDTSAWINGPDFTTKDSAAIAMQLSNSSTLQKITITPNPGNGDFVLKLQLPTQPATTVAYIYTSDARQVWKQELGNINNTYTKRFNLSGILTPGVNILQIKRNDLSMSATIIIKK